MAMNETILTDLRRARSLVASQRSRILNLSAATQLGDVDAKKLGEDLRLECEASAQIDAVLEMLQTLAGVVTSA